MFDPCQASILGEAGQVREQGGREERDTLEGKYGLKSMKEDRQAALLYLAESRQC